MGALLVVALVAQFRKDRYEPGIYWLAVVLISIVGTLITDNLTDNLGVSLSPRRSPSASSSAATFAVWFSIERTLSIHTIYTTRREGFYWLRSCSPSPRYSRRRPGVGEAGAWLLGGGAIFAGAIGAVAIGHYVFKLNAVLAFWLAYILTRPLGASIGDGMSQTDGGGLNWAPP